MDFEYEKQELLDLANILQDEIDNYTIRLIRFLSDKRSDLLYGGFLFSGKSSKYQIVLSSYGHIMDYDDNMPVQLMSVINFVIVESLRNKIENLCEKLADQTDTLAEDWCINESYLRE